MYGCLTEPFKGEISRGKKSKFWENLGKLKPIVLIVLIVLILLNLLGLEAFLIFFACLLVILICYSFL